jgi:hypothetical protein
MTKDEFDRTSFKKGTKALYEGKELVIVEVDFENRDVTLKFPPVGYGLVSYSEITIINQEKSTKSKAK